MGVREAQRDREGGGEPMTHEQWAVISESSKSFGITGLVKRSGIQSLVAGGREQRDIHIY